MKTVETRSHRYWIAFTVIELVAVIAAVAALFVLLLAGLLRARQQTRERQCVNNLKHIGLAFRQWAIDGSDKFATQRPTAYGGSMESVTNGQVFFTFVVMSNELNSPKILICPADDRIAATNFGLGSGNSNVSYFVGITADETMPQMLLSGDRNLTNGPLPPNRLLRLTTNSAPGWDHQLHKSRDNLALSDGSARPLDTPRLRVTVTNSGTDNLLAFP